MLCADSRRYNPALSPDIAPTLLNVIIYNKKNSLWHSVICVFPSKNLLSKYARVPIRATLVCVVLLYGVGDDGVENMTYIVSNFCVMEQSARAKCVEISRVLTRTPSSPVKYREIIKLALAE